MLRAAQVARFGTLCDAEIRMKSNGPIKTTRLPRNLRLDSIQRNIDIRFQPEEDDEMRWTGVQFASIPGQW